MAVGRISGPLLKSNLTRNGIDLAFETNLLYLDVNNSRLGVKTSSPQYELDVNGTTKTTNLVATTATLSDISFANNTISTNSPYLNLGTLDNVVYQNKLRIDSIDIEGNTITTNASNANLELRANGTGAVNIPDYTTKPYVFGYSLYATNSNGRMNFGGYTSYTISSAASDANGYGTFEYAPPTGYYALCTKNLAEYG